MELWIARDKDGDLFLFPLKPIRAADVFIGGGYMQQIGSHLLPEVTWENSPKKAELRLVETKDNINKNETKDLQKY